MLQSWRHEGRRSIAHSILPSITNINTTGDIRYSNVAATNNQADTYNEALRSWKQATKHYQSY
jgi:hypothetical protein